MKYLRALALRPAAEEHAVGHDGGHLAVGLEHRQHVLDEHQVGLLALLGHPAGKRPGNSMSFLM